MYVGLRRRMACSVQAPGLGDDPEVSIDVDVLGDCAGVDCDGSVSVAATGAILCHRAEVRRAVGRGGGTRARRLATGLGRDSSWESSGMAVVSTTR